MLSKKMLTLNRNGDFKRLYKKGKSRVHALLVTYAMKNRLSVARMAVVSSKKIGGAVQRNRARRVVRAAVNSLPWELPSGWDFIFVCRARTVKEKSTALMPVLEKQLEQLLSEDVAR